MNMALRTRAFLVIATVLAAACSPPPAGQSEDRPARPAAVAPAPERPLDAPADMAPDFVASTNEPFWTVTVKGNTVTLAGIEVTRDLIVQSNEAMFDGRNVVATDAQGQVEVRVTPRACQDSMAGDHFPYTARVTIDGGTPVLGCARDP